MEHNGLGRRGIKLYLKFAVYELVNLSMKLLPYPQLRSPVLRLFGARIGKKSRIYDVTFHGAEFGGFSNLSVGNNVHIGRGTIIDLVDKVTLEDYAVLTSGSRIFTHASPGENSPMQKYYPEIHAPVRIKKGSWIGAGAIVLAGVTVGEMSLVGAGSVVTKDVPPHSLATGLPAKVIRKIKE